MRISRIEIHPFYAPFQGHNAAAISRYHGRQIQARTVYVVHTDTGLEGLGEAWGPPPADAEGLRSRYVGTSPFDWVNADADLAMNMACYDLIGKHLGLPAWKLMGPQVRTWIPVAAWTVSQAPEVMAEEVRQAADRGYRWLKYHVDETQNVIAQAEAMQAAAPPWFRVHYDFNATRDAYTMRPILAALERLPVSGRFEDVVRASDEEGYRLLRAHCRLPILAHHGPAEFMGKGLVDGFIAGHAPIGLAMKLGAMAEMTDTPIMYQQCGGTINRAFLAHEASVVPMATVDHVDLCHLWTAHATVEDLPVVSGSVAVPSGPGLGVDLDRDALERHAEPPPEPAPFLVRMAYGSGLTVYARHGADRSGHADSLRFLSRLHGCRAPGPPPSWDNDVVTDFWDGADDPAAFAVLWAETESGPAWRQG